MKRVVAEVPAVVVNRKEFLADRQGRTFADVVNDDTLPFDEILAFFSDGQRQRRMEESELHHDRAPLAGVVRELESQPDIDRFLGAVHAQRTQRLRQAIGVLIRIIMEQRGWRKTGRKGSLGVRAEASPGRPSYNKGGLAFWFVRAERYEPTTGVPFRTVPQRKQELEASPPKRSTKAKRRRARA